VGVSSRFRARERGCEDVTCYYLGKQKKYVENDLPVVSAKEVTRRHDLEGFGHPPAAPGIDARALVALARERMARRAGRKGPWASAT
jgi:hypothetical protein